MVSIVGDSGVGKSTLLHILGGLERPSQGEVRIGALRLNEQTESDLARFRNEEVGFVFQFHHLMPDFTALENVMMPSLISGMSSTSAQGAAIEVLERVGLADRLEHRPGELSGGEQQRVAVARAVVRKPALVLADEPTGNLDPQTAAEIETLLVEMNRESRTTCVVVTHNGRLAAAMDRQLRLTPGGIEES